MNMCVRCEKNGNEVKLLDGISGTEIIKICERCSIIEGIPLIKKPTTSQLRDAEKATTVEQRLRKIAGLEKKEEKHESILEKIKKLDEHPEFEKPEEKRPFNLIDNFHWHLQRARRNRGLSHKQVAWALGESETAIKMIEHGDLPEDSGKLIKKLEQFFQIKIRERSFQEQEEDERIKKQKLQEKYKIPRVDMEKVERELNEEPIKSAIREPEINDEDIISIAGGRNIFLGEEEKIKRLEQAEIEERKSGISPVKILSFNPEVLKDITISDLQEIKNEKEREDKLLMLEEERKKSIEETRKLKLKEIVSKEMKDVALGRNTGKRQVFETLQEKRQLLNQALNKVSLKPEEKQKIEMNINKTPTIAELAERKREREMVNKKEEVTGDEIEIIGEKNIRDYKNLDDADKIKEVLSEDDESKIDWIEDD